jgi:hypothetical protein
LSLFHFRTLALYSTTAEHQRERIVEGKTGEATPEEVVTSVEAILSKSKTKRRHRKSHGKISFGDLARNIAESWKSVSPKNKSIFEHYAERDMLRYKRELKVWRDKKDLELEADTLARHSKFMSSMGSSFSGSVGSEASISHTSTSDFIESLPDEGAARTGGGAVGGGSSASSHPHGGRPETASFNSSLSSLDSQPTPMGSSRRGSGIVARRQSGTNALTESPSPIAPMSMADQVIQRQQQILSQQMMLDRSNNTTSSSSMNISMSSQTNDRSYSGGGNFMPPSSFGMGPSSAHSMPAGMGMGMGMGSMMGPAGMNAFGAMGISGSGAGSMHSMPSMPTGTGSGISSDQHGMITSRSGSNTMMGSETVLPMGMNMGASYEGGNMSFPENNPMGFPNEMSLQQHLQQQQHQRQQQQQQFQHQQHMAMLHSSSGSLQFGDVLGGGGGGGGGGAPNLVSDHTRTSMGQHSAAFNNSQSSFAAFGNSMSSFGHASMMPPFQSSGLSSSSHHGVGGGVGGGGGGGSGMRNPTQGGGNFAMMSQLGMHSYHGGMSHPVANLQRRQQQGHMGHISSGGTNTNLSSSSYHSGMRSASMHGMLQTETIDEHSHQDQDYESSFAFPPGEEGFYDKSDDRD